MKNTIALLAASAIFLLFACKEKPAPQRPETPPTPQLDFTIVPGERVGLVTKNACTREAVLAAYGDSAVVDSVYLDEGMMDEGLVLFPNNPRRTAYLWWDKEFDPKHIGFIRIISTDLPTGGADWKTDSGLAIGSTIADVEKLNGKTFDIFGFGWDYGGRVTDWKGGKFDGTGFGMLFSPAGDETDETLLGEKNIPSNDPILLKAEPRIVTFEIRFPVRDSLPPCLAEKANGYLTTEPVLTVKKMTVNGQDHFWFSDGAAAYDGIEYIYDTYCKEVCKVGGFRKPLDCSKVYDAGKWEVVWQEF
ncbi:MAG: hypothetical protein HY842_10455 [Bacteroidetes bacterium]|nr:hypothetical protein [Bacteroidota bacterium]